LAKCDFDWQNEKELATEDTEKKKRTNPQMDADKLGFKQDRQDIYFSSLCSFV
jgi:hypothetical protein